MALGVSTWMNDERQHKAARKPYYPFRVPSHGLNGYTEKEPFLNTNDSLDTLNFYIHQITNLIY